MATQNSAIAPVQVEHPRRRKQTGNVIDLPAHIQPSERELVNIVRLMRLLRGGDWLAYYVESLLMLDAEGTTQVPVQTAQDMLVHMKNLVAWEKAFQTMKAEVPALKYYPDWPEPYPLAGAEGDEMDFYELVRLWRLEHPEPRPKQKIPEEELPEVLQVRLVP